MAKDTVKIFCRYSKLMDPDKLEPTENNPNFHPPAQIELYKKILQSLGFRKCIVVSNQTKRIVTGHGAWIASKQLGIKVPVDYQDFDSADQERAFMLADNRLGMKAELDFIATGDLMKQFPADFDLELTGFTPDELERAEVQIKKLEAPPAPKMAWVLIGIPTVRFGEINQQIESIAAVAGSIVAAALTTDRFDIESINGRNVTIDVVRDWQRNGCYGSMFGGWKVKIINEMDLIPVAAQDLLLTYLDEIPPMTAVLGTSNADCATLTTRFETRFQFVTVEAPTQQEISRFLMSRFGLPKKPAEFIAFGCTGNVRQACLEASSFQMFDVLPEKREAKKEVVCTARSAAAHKAWETMRAKAA